MLKLYGLLGLSLLTVASTTPTSAIAAERGNSIVFATTEDDQTYPRGVVEGTLVLKAAADGSLSGSFSDQSDPGPRLVTGSVTPDHHIIIQIGGQRTITGTVIKGKIDAYRNGSGDTYHFAGVAIGEKDT